MKDIKYKYFIIKGINDSIKTIIDRERKVIFEIRDGNYINKTKEIMRIYEKDKKTDFMKGYVGTKFLNAIVDGESNNFSSREILLKTNDRKKFDMECMQIRKDQTERRLNSINRDFEKLLKGEQYYTYAFSNLDYVIGEDKLDDRYFQNNNSLIIKGDKYYYQYCVGGKTGYTKEAKNCMVSLASKDGMDLIAVVLKGETTETGESARNRDTINLFEYGYENYNLQTIKKKGETVTSVDIKDAEGNTKQLKVKLENDISIVNKEDNESKKDVKPEINVNVENAPVEKGEVVGTATYKINGEEYKANLVAAETIEETRDNVNENSSIYTILKTIILIISAVIILKMFTRIRICSSRRNKRGYKKVTRRKQTHSISRGKHSIFVKK